MKLRLPIVLLFAALCCSGLCVGQIIDTSKTSPRINAAIRLVMMHYPNLAYKQIRFRQANISVTMQCRPTVWSTLFRKRSKRTYCITINTSGKKTGFTADTLPSSVLPGLLGHEMAHILDYASGGIGHVAKRGIDYCCVRRKRDFEHSIDSLTIVAGLGCYLYRWTKYVETSASISAEYKRIKQTIYFSSEEIRQRLTDSTCTDTPQL